MRDKSQSGLAFDEPEPIVAEQVSAKPEVIESVPAKKPAPTEQDCADSEARFGQSRARLFPMIGYQVDTPEGPAKLLQVSADNVTVVLEQDPGRCAWFKPEDIRPSSEVPEVTVSPEKWIATDEDVPF